MGRAGVLQTMAASECGCEQMYGLMRIQIQISVQCPYSAAVIIYFHIRGFKLSPLCRPYWSHSHSQQKYDHNGNLWCTE